MRQQKCRDPDLNYKDLWISIKYCRNPVKDILTIFKNITHEEEQWEEPNTVRYLLSKLRKKCSTYEKENIMNKKFYNTIEPFK